MTVPFTLFLVSLRSATLIFVWLLNCLGQKLLDPVESLVELLTSHEPAVVVRANRIAVGRETEGLLEGRVSGVGV